MWKGCSRTLQSAVVIVLLSHELSAIWMGKIRYWVKFIPLSALFYLPCLKLVSTIESNDRFTFEQEQQQQRLLSKRMASGHIRPPKQCIRWPCECVASTQRTSTKHLNRLFFCRILAKFFSDNFQTNNFTPQFSVWHAYIACIYSVFGKSSLKIWFKFSRILLLITLNDSKFNACSQRNRFQSDGWTKFHRSSIFDVALSIVCSSVLP